MRRWLPTMAAAALLALAALAAVGVLRPAAEASRAEQVQRIAAELRCPDCQALSVADSPTESAVEIRRQIDAMLAAGRSPDEIRAHFVARYGEWILLAPSAPLAWLLPGLALVAGVLALVAWLRRMPDSRAPAPVREDSAEQLRRIRDEVEALDA